MFFSFLFLEITASRQRNRHGALRKKSEIHNSFNQKKETTLSIFHLSTDCSETNMYFRGGETAMSLYDKLDWEVRRTTSKCQHICRKNSSILEKSPIYCKCSFRNAEDESRCIRASKFRESFFRPSHNRQPFHSNPAYRKAKSPDSIRGTLKRYGHPKPPDPRRKETNRKESSIGSRGNQRSAATISTFKI